MKNLIGTRNPGKIEGVKRAFSKYFTEVEVEGFAVESDVSEQPFDDEVLKGAKNRVKNVKKLAEHKGIKADFYVGIEGGITNSLGTIIELNMAVVEDNNNFQSVGTSPGFSVPERYIDEIKKTDFGKLMDKLFNGKKLSDGKGGISFLTKEQVSRIDMVELATTMALASHINADLWK